MTVAFQAAYPGSNPGRRISFINKEICVGTMRQETIVIQKVEYEKLKEKAKIADDALVQLKLGLEDLRHGRVAKFDSKSS